MSRFAHFTPLRRMREGIPIYKVAVGVQSTEERGYHETLTCLWAKIVGDFVAAGEFATPYAAVKATVQRFGRQRKLHQEFLYIRCGDGPARAARMGAC
jgi:hypothetical protein